MISRRELVKGGLAALGFSALPKFAALAELTSKGRSYSVPVLGDIHFDSPDPKFYHANYTHSTSQKRYKAHLAEHVRNSEMWKERLPRLVRASGACLRKDAAFALQMGDLVQGDCGNAAMHRQMLDDAFGLVKGAYGGKMPLVVASGNHDIRGDMKGDGARKTMEYEFPHQGFNRPMQQFMLGSKWLVAPVITPDDAKTVELPAGKWRDDLGTTHVGPKTIQLKDVPLDRLPHYERLP